MYKHTIFIDDAENINSTDLNNINNKTIFDIFRSNSKPNNILFPYSKLKRHNNDHGIIKFKLKRNLKSFLKNC